ncbi:hypothetical protein [Sporomusa silvacetica]
MEYYDRIYEYIQTKLAAKVNTIVSKQMVSRRFGKCQEFADEEGARD